LVAAFDPKLFEQPGELFMQPSFEIEFLAIKKDVEAKEATLATAYEKEHAAAKSGSERTAAFMRLGRELHKIEAPAAEKVMHAVRSYAADSAAVEALVLKQAIPATSVGGVR